MDVEDDISLKAEEDIPMSKNTIIGRAQFTSEFGQVRDEAMELMEKEDTLSSVEDNMYKCEGIVTLLTGHYLGLFPLWSGIFLGNMEQYASESKKQPQPITPDCERTRDTNSHVECWFGILKNSILQRRRKMRPADFICTLHSSLRGRYKEHMIGHGLSVGSKCSKLKRKKEAMELTEEQWAKRVATSKKSKYYSVPPIMPVPKKTKSHRQTEKKGHFC